MNYRFCLLVIATAICCQPFAAAEDLPPIPPIARVLPPEGIEIPAEVRQRLETRLAATKKRILEYETKTETADIEIFTKAVELALAHREFYVEKDFAKAEWALDEANKRLDWLDRDESPWLTQTGPSVHGYRSEIDGSVQPFGVYLPADFDFKADSHPTYIWLHGRGDKTTDLHFLYERATKSGQITPPGAIVLHPFGRHCVGWKHAGEIDVFEAMMASTHGIDSDRALLAGFSMGGAGAWHIGAHYADEWAAVSPGAGFAETARYQNLMPEKYPPWYEQKLWGMYDVPGYVRNLFNVPVIAYSGENDKQIQAALVMEEAYAAEGKKLTHLIGPGVEHKYEPKTLEQLLEMLQAAVASPDRPGHPFSGPYHLSREMPKSVHFQTQTLQYNRMHWVWLEGLQEHWKDARIDAEIVAENRVRVATENIASLRLGPWVFDDNLSIEIDGQNLEYKPDKGKKVQLIWLSRNDRNWSLGSLPAELRKQHWLQGPIDHAFMSEFLVVAPSGKSRNAAFQAWCDFELAHFQARWKALMRAELPLKRDVDVVPSDWNRGVNLILWGDADSNSVLKQFADVLPIKFVDTGWSFGDKVFDGNQFVPAVIYPNLLQKPVSRQRLSPAEDARGYIVLNSGLTFREGHDRTNSLQNPKLPDWAIIDITQPPDAFAPGRIHDAGFFDEKWQLKSQPKAP